MAKCNIKIIEAAILHSLILITMQIQIINKQTGKAEVIDLANFTRGTLVRDRVRIGSKIYDLSSAKEFKAEADVKAKAKAEADVKAKAKAEADAKAKAKAEAEAKAEADAKAKAKAEAEAKAEADVKAKVIANKTK